ncbi:MAG: recombinase A [bacterium]
MATLPLPTARTLTQDETAPRADWPEGMLVEISGAGASARLSSATSAVLRAQREGETIAWIQPPSPRRRAHGIGPAGAFYPPDLAASGIDLDALPVIRLPEDSGESAPYRAAELLLRSGAFGLVVVDLRGQPRRIPAAWPGRLLGCAREHQARVLFLTAKEKEQDSIGALVALRLEPRRKRIRPGLFVVENRVLKNKPGLSLVVEAQRHRGPWGLS